MRIALPFSRARLFVAILLVLPVPAAAQHIPIKTVPIPTGEQFSIFPSRNMGMGDVRIATDDRLLDPFANPARGARVSRLHVHALPTFYRETNQWVGGRTLPLAVVVPGQRVFGAAAFALQQVNTGNRWTWAPPGTGGSVIRDNSSSNRYLLGMLGTRLNEDRTAIGLSIYHADLDAVDGVGMLYGNSIGIEQSGRMTEFRFGALHDLGGERTLELVVLNHRLDMTHDVEYAEWQWNETGQAANLRRWKELNEDRTITWAGQARYTQPLDDAGARIGMILAGNTKAHPKIPNYNIVNIPRDPGNSAMFNIGAGISNTDGPALVGLDVVYEPGRSHTWAFADSAMTTPEGTIAPGEKTIDNQFRFSNWTVGLGAQYETDRRGIQFGLRLREIRYTLDQHNFLTATQRNTRESWMEWTPTWGAVLKFPELEVRYTGRFTAKGWPQTACWWGCWAVADMASAPGAIDFVVGPTGEVWLPEYRVTTHRLMVSVPLGAVR
jgi:hypothetical protein